MRCLIGILATGQYSRRGQGNIALLNKMALNMSKRILVIGGTGAQGSRVVSSLLASKSKFSVRVLSRDPESDYVKNLFSGLKVELVKGQQKSFRLWL